MVFKHVISLLFVALTVGGVVFEPTEILPKVRQPVMLSVTVTVYEPAAVTDLLAVVPPPLHAKEALVDDVAFKSMLEAIHVKSPVFVTLTTGAVTMVIVLEAVAVQPPAFEAVTV